MGSSGVARIGLLGDLRRNALVLGNDVVALAPGDDVLDIRDLVTWMDCEVVRVGAELLGPLFFVMGLTASSLILVWSCVREVNNPAHVGIVIGFCNAPIFLAFAVLQWLTGAILDATWTGLEAGGVRIYPEAGYRTAFGVCLALAAGSLVMTLLVTETRCRNIWRRATH